VQKLIHCFQNASAYVQKIILSPISQTLSFSRPSKRALFENCILGHAEMLNELGDAPGVEYGEGVFKLKRSHYCDRVVSDNTKFSKPFHSNSANNFDFSGGIVPPTCLTAQPFCVPVDSLIPTKAISSPDYFAYTASATPKANWHVLPSEHIVKKRFQNEKHHAFGNVDIKLSVHAISLQMSPLFQIDVGSANLNECDKVVAILDSFRMTQVQQVSMHQMMKNAALTDTKTNRAIVNSLVAGGRLLVKGRSRSTRYKLAVGN
jgi:hypothetical protein